MIVSLYHLYVEGISGSLTEERKYTTQSAILRSSVWLASDNNKHLLVNY